MNGRWCEYLVYGGVLPNQRDEMDEGAPALGRACGYDDPPSEKMSMVMYILRVYQALGNIES